VERTQIGVKFMEYKKKVEKLPEEWEVVRLGNIGTIITGSTPLTEKQEYYGDTYKFVTPEDIQENKYVKNTNRMLSELGFKIQRKIPPKSICVVCIASLGKIALTTSWCSTNQQINTLIPSDKHDPEALYYFMLLYVPLQLKIEAGLQVVPIVNKTKFSNILIPLPPLPEQQKIAEILETVDNAIEKTKRIIEKYKRIKQGLMQDLLTKGIDENDNIRSEKTHKFKDSPLGRIPEEWEVVRLGDIIYFKNGKSPSFSEVGIYPIYGSNGLIGFSNIYQFEGEHLIVGRVGASGEAHFVSGKFFASDNCLVGRLLREKELNLKYIFYYLKYFDLKRFITQTAQPLITQSLINNLHISLPPLPEQQRIAEILSQTDQTIEKEQQYKEKLQKIKQGLMQDLLTGKVRVNHLLNEGEGYVQA